MKAIASPEKPNDELNEYVRENTEMFARI